MLYRARPKLRSGYGMERLRGHRLIDAITARSRAIGITGTRQRSRRPTRFEIRASGRNGLSRRKSTRVSRSGKHWRGARYRTRLWSRPADWIQADVRLAWEFGGPPGRRPRTGYRDQHDDLQRYSAGSSLRYRAAVLEFQSALSSWSNRSPVRIAGRHAWPDSPRTGKGGVAERASLVPGDMLIGVENPSVCLSMTWPMLSRAREKGCTFVLSAAVRADSADHRSSGVIRVAIAGPEGMLRRGLESRCERILGSIGRRRGNARRHRRLRAATS